MKVKAAPIKTTAGTYYLLKNTDNRVVYNAPNKWKTKRGAEMWASNNGYTLQTAAKAAKKKAAAGKKPAKRAPARTSHR